MNVEVVSREIFEARASIMKHKERLTGSPEKNNKLPVFTFYGVASTPTVSPKESQAFVQAKTTPRGIIETTYISSKSCRELGLFQNEPSMHPTAKRDLVCLSDVPCKERFNRALEGRPAQLLFGIARIKRTHSLKSKLVFRVFERYNKSIEYKTESFGYIADLKVWEINESQLESNCLSKDVLIALQLHIYCRQLGFPAFIRSVHNEFSWIGSLKRLLSIILQDVSLQNRLFLQAKAMLCLCMEYTSKGKFGKAERYLMQAQSILQMTETCDFHGWFHLAAAYLYQTLSQSRNIIKPQLTETVLGHLQEAWRCFSTDTAEGLILESTLILWWIFLVKTEMTHKINVLMPEHEDLRKSGELTLPVECKSIDCGLPYYELFFNREEKLHLIPKEAVEKVHRNSHPFVAKMQDVHQVREHEIKEEAGEDQISKLMEEGFEALAEHLEKGYLADSVQVAYLNERTQYIHIHTASDETELMKTVTKLIPNIIDRVVVRKSQFLFAGDEDRKKILGADHERSRVTYGQQKSTFGPGSIVFPIKEEHKDNVLLAGDIHDIEDIKKKVCGIEKTPTSTTVTCITIDKEGIMYALTVQHLFTLEEGCKTKEDLEYCVVSQINHQSKPNDTPEEVFLVGDKYCGIYCNSSDSEAQDETQVNHSGEAISRPDRASNSQATDQQEGKDTQGRTMKKRVIDLSAIEIKQDLQQKDHFQPFLLNDSGDPVSLEMQTNPSQIHKGIDVQKTGAASGLTKGKIISTKSIMNLGNGEWTREGFVVCGSEDETFVTYGDSGALVTPVIGTAKKTLAMGYVYKYCESNGNGSSLAICLNFKEGLHNLNTACQLDVVIHNPLESLNQDSGIKDVEGNSSGKPSDVQQPPLQESVEEDSLISDTTDSENNTLPIKNKEISSNIHSQAIGHQKSVEQKAASKPKQKLFAESDSGIEKDNEL